MKYIWLCIIVIGMLAAGVLLAASNKINIGQILGPGASQNGFVLGVTPGGQLTFLGLGTGLSIAGSTINASGSALPNFADYVTVPGTPNGVTTTFTLANAPVVGSVGVFKNGLLMQAGVGNEYTVSGSVVTFAVAPLATDLLQASYRF